MGRPSMRARGERGDRARRALPGDLAGAEHGRQPQRHGASAVQPAGLLAEALGEAVGIGRRVEPGPRGGGEDEQRVVGRAGLQQVDGRADVLAHGGRGVLARSRGIGHPGEVQDRVAAVDERARRGVARVDDVVDAQVRRGCARPAAGAGERDDVVPASLEHRRRAPAEVARRTGDEDPHARRYSATRCSYVNGVENVHAGIARGLAALGERGDVGDRDRLGHDVGGLDARRRRGQEDARGVGDVHDPDGRPPAPVDRQRLAARRPSSGTCRRRSATAGRSCSTGDAP